MSLLSEIETALNKYSAENESDTPDFILASYLTNCLKCFDAAVVARDAWHGFHAANNALKEPPR